MRHNLKRDTNRNHICAMNARPSPRRQDFLAIPRAWLKIYLRASQLKAHSIMDPLQPQGCLRVRFSCLDSCFSYAALEKDSCTHTSLATPSQWGQSQSCGIHSAVILDGSTRFCLIAVRDRAILHLAAWRPGKQSSILEAVGPS